MSEPKIGVRKALSLSFLQRYISLALSIATVVIVSRLLTPAEIGVYSVAMGMIAVVQMLRDFGVSDYLIQERELTDEAIRTAFTVNLVIAWSMAALLFACSGLVGAFFHEPGAARVTRVVSLVMVLLPFGSVPMTLLRRHLRYDRMLKIRLAETVARGGTTIGLAYAGFTYMSMAWAGVAGMATLVLGCAFWGRDYRYRGFSLAHWRKVLHFGVNRTLADLAAQAGDQSANIVVGRMLGMSAAGFYSRGYGIVNIFRTNVIGAIREVAFPAYAQEHREQDAAPALYRKSLVYLTAICWPFFAFVILMAFPVMRIVFGPQWDAAVPLMRWLCGAAMVGTLTYNCSSFLTAVGAYQSVTRIETLYQLVRIGLAVAAAFYGLQAVAASQVLVYVLAAVLYHHRMAQYPALRLRPLVVALAPSALVTLAACVVPAAVLFGWPGGVRGHFLLAFMVAGFGSAAGWLLALAGLRHPLWQELRRGIKAALARVLRQRSHP